MFEIQHLSQLRWDNDVWNLIARRESLARCVTGIRRICDEPGRSPDHYRIVEFHPKGRVKAIYDARGKQTDGFLVTPDPKHAARKRRKLIAA